MLKMAQMTCVPNLVILSWLEMVKTQLIIWWEMFIKKYA